MNIRELAMWYFIGGTVTSLIGIYRGMFKNKQSIEPDELTSLSWFLLWFIWLPTFLVGYIKQKIKKYII